jgi:hypothetical protein
MPEEKKSKWMYGPVVVLFLSTIFLICTIIIISSPPKPAYQVLGDSIIILSGESGQTAHDSIIILLKPNSSKITNINVSGVFFENIFNTTTGFYNAIELSDDVYSRLFLKVSLNDTIFAYNVGTMDNHYITLTTSNTGFLPITDMSVVKFNFSYTFPKVYYLFSKPTYNITTTYVFKPTFRFMGE